MRPWFRFEVSDEGKDAYWFFNADGTRAFRASPLFLISAMMRLRKAARKASRSALGFASVLTSSAVVVAEYVPKILASISSTSIMTFKKAGLPSRCCFSTTALVGLGLSFPSGPISNSSRCISLSCFDLSQASMASASSDSSLRSCYCPASCDRKLISSSFDPAGKRPMSERVQSQQFQSGPGTMGHASSRRTQ